VPSTITFSQKGTKNIEEWKSLIGKQFTGITSYVISADKDNKKAWRNQELNMNVLFTANRLSQTEVNNGKTEPVAINSAIADAKANAKIKFSDQKKAICIAELKLVNGLGKVPVTETGASADAVNSEDDPF